MRRQSESAGAGDDRMYSDITEPVQGVLHKGAKSALNIRVVPAVIGKHYFAGGIQDRDFDGGGSDVDSQSVVS